jgi:hypothetical protein
MALMVVVHAVTRNFGAMPEERDWAGSFSKPIDLYDDGSPPSLESAASPALFYSQSNIDQRIGNLKTKLAPHHWSRHAIAGDRFALSLIRESS